LRCLVFRNVSLSDLLHTTLAYTVPDSAAPFSFVFAFAFRIRILFILGPHTVLYYSYVLLIVTLFLLSSRHPPSPLHTLAFGFICTRPTLTLTCSGFVGVCTKRVHTCPYLLSTQHTRCIIVFTLLDSVFAVVVLLTSSITQDCAHCIDSRVLFITAEAHIAPVHQPFTHLRLEVDAMTSTPTSFIQIFSSLLIEKRSPLSFLGHGNKCVYIFGIYGRRFHNIELECRRSRVQRYIVCIWILEV